MKRVAVFLDGANFYFTQKKMGWTVDTERLLEHCKQYGDLVEALYYTGAPMDSSQKKFHDMLAYLGYALVTKPVKTIYDHCSGQSLQKANLDVEIVLDMFNMIDRYDMAILISGDGDFERAVQLLKSRGKEVKVISTRGCVANELVHSVGIHYVDLLALKEVVERKTVSASAQAV